MTSAVLLHYFLLAQQNQTLTENLEARTLAESNRLQAYAKTATDFLVLHGVDFLMGLVTAAAVLIIGQWIARWVTSLTRGVMLRARVDETLVNFVSNLSYWLLMMFVIISALAELGVDTTSAAAVMAAAGLAIGLALQSSLSNFASGVMLILFKPFRVGDFVEVDGISGIIEAIEIFQTVMRTPDNIQQFIPNGNIMNNKIKNYSRKPMRRIDLVVSCSYSDPLLSVKEFLEELLAADERIVDEPAPEVRVFELAANSVDFVVRPWVATPDFWATKCDLLEAIKLGFDDRGFNIPFPQQEIHVVQKAG